MTPLRHPAPDRTTGAALADTDIQAGTTPAARRHAACRNGAATMLQLEARISDSKTMEVTALAGDQA
jgi:hypothetical protein